MQDTSSPSRCSLCEGAGFSRATISEPVGGISFSIHSCTRCGLRYTYPTPPQELLDSVYSGDYWPRESRVRKLGGFARLAHRFNEMRLAVSVLPLLRRLRPGARILEVGCGAGRLALHLKRKGYDVEVTDVAQEVLDEIADGHGLVAHHGTLESIAFSGRYDAVVLDNVLEHLADPVGALRIVRGLLSDAGIVFVEVPNTASFQFSLFGGRWYGNRIPEHLFHFSPRTLDAVAGSAGLQRLWYSTFSAKTAAVGYVASLFPALQPERVRFSESAMILFSYFALQALFTPICYAEALLGRGACVRVIYAARAG